MPARVSYDCVVVGSGPNGLSAAIRLAQARLSVLVVEGNETLGGGARSAALTLPEFLHDTCSAVHPLGVASPFFRTIPLEKYGLQWVHPPLPLAHPLEDGDTAVLARSLKETAAGLGSDALAYESLLAPFAADWQELLPELLRPLLRVPKRPWLLARFGLQGLRAAAELASARFSGEPARALFAGMAAHSFLPLERRNSAAVGLVLALAGHGEGWPLVHGGSQQLAAALAAHLRQLGGEIVTRFPAAHLDDLPLAKAVLLDLTPRQVLRVAGKELPPSYRARLERFRYAPGVFKLDYALDAPVPWKAEACSRAGTVHVCGSWQEVCASEREVNQGKHPQKPFVLLAQPTLFDPGRAPEGTQTLWAYCHVPNGSTFDMTERIERQIERFAPGFRDRILARRKSTCAQLEQYNPNLVGGDISGGAMDFRQVLARPICSPNPYRTPVPGLYLCSASTPPGGGVHGMCGFHAAECVLHDLRSGRQRLKRA